MLHVLFVPIGKLRSAKPFRKRSCWVPILSSLGQPHLDSEHRLMKDLFANYSKEVRPVIDKEKPIPVNFDMMFSQLVELVCMAGKHLFNGRFTLFQTKLYNLWYLFLYTLFQTWCLKLYTLSRDHPLPLHPIYIWSASWSLLFTDPIIFPCYLLVFPGAFERLIVYLSLSLKMFQLKHLNRWWWLRWVFVFCCLYCVERTKSDYDEQGLDQTGKIEDHVSFF